MNFSLWRILGNDLPPRHSATQTEDNLRFILEHEVPFAGCQKCFLLNRIIDREKLDRLIDLIERHDYTYIVTPFDPAEYRSHQSRTDHVRYLTNVNEARNFCVQVGLQNRDIALPLDGGSFFRADGWESFVNVALDCPEDGFFAIPTWRVWEYETALGSELPTLREEYRLSENEKVISLRECSIAFTKKHDCAFNDRLVYGQVDKAELMWRLGIPGAWDRWSPDLRDAALAKPSKFYNRTRVCGHVIRLPSGDDSGDQDNLVRGSHRGEGIQRLLEAANMIR